MNSLRPVNRYFARATAATNARTTETTRAAATTKRLFFTVSQKYGRAIASRKWSSVGDVENHVGVRLLISSSGLNAVETIQKTGKTSATKTATPTTSQPRRRSHRRRAERGG